MAWREIGLAAGEPPTTQGLSALGVRAAARACSSAPATAQAGGITGFYTVLVDGDDFNEPVADAARSILDGHIVLTRQLAAGKHFPAIDVLESISRVRDDVIDPLHLARRRDRCSGPRRRSAPHEDLIAVGAYKPGADRQVDAAVALRPGDDRVSLAAGRPKPPPTTSRALSSSSLTGRLQAHQNGRPDEELLFRLERVLQLRSRRSRPRRAGRRRAARRGGARLFSEAAPLRVAEAIDQMARHAEELRTAGSLGNPDPTLEAARARAAEAAERIARPSSGSRPESPASSRPGRPAGDRELREQRQGA